MKKFLCGITAVLMACAFVSCSESQKESSSVSGEQLVGGADKDVNLSEDDMPYGSTLYELSSENDDYVSIIIDFDKRYFSDEDGNPNYDEVHKLHDYVIAVDTNNHDLFNSVTYPGFYEYYCEKSNTNVDDYIDVLSSDFHYDIGDDSTIDFIDISNCIYSGENAQSYFDVRDEIFTAIGVNEITSRKLVEIGGYTTYSNSQGTYQLINHTDPIIVCVYEIDGQFYVL